MIKFHEIEKKSLFDLCPPDVDKKEWDEFRANYHKAEKLEILKNPPQIDIELNAGCNMSCPFCWHGYNKIKNKTMPVSTYKKIIDEAVRFGLKSLKLTYINEPLLRHDLEDCIKYAKKSGILNVYMVTNGVLLNKKRYDRLIDSGITKVFCSIDAVTEETYNKQRLSGKFEQVVNNIKGFIDRRNERGLKFPLVRVSFVRNKLNKHEELSFKKTWENIADLVVIQNMTEVPDVKTGLRLNKSITNQNGCAFPFKQLVVDTYGDILPCCKMGGKKLALGNIKNMTLEQAWNSKKMKHLKWIHKNNLWTENKTCSDCILNN